MIKLFQFDTSATPDTIAKEVNAFIADQWEDAREEWRVAGPATVWGENQNRLIITLILKRGRL